MTRLLLVLGSKSKLNKIVEPDNNLSNKSLSLTPIQDDTISESSILLFKCF